MRFIGFISLFLAGIFGGISPAEEAKTAYDNGEFYKAAKLYAEFLGQDDYDGQEQVANYNSGQAYLKTDSNDIPLPDSIKAQRDPKRLPINLEFAAKQFQNATAGKDNLAASLAWNNIGVLLATQGEIEPALNAFKNAMRKFHDNDYARFNYELLMKKKQQQEQENQDQNKDQENQEKKDQENQEKQDNKEQEKQDEENQEKNENEENQDKQDQQEKEKEEQEGEKGDDEDKQQKRNQENNGEPQELREIPMEQAKMLLEAMNENEKKYLQQLRKKPRVRTRPNDGPDW